MLLGLLCFRLEDVTRALLGITHLSFGTVLRQMLAVLSQEVQEAIIVVLPAALAVTLAAGRGKRDPSRDLELGAAAYIPFFAVRAVYRAADLEALLGPLPRGFNQAASRSPCCGRRADRRAGHPARPRPAAGRRPIPRRQLPPSADPGPVPWPGTRARLAVAGLGALAGAALAVNGTWVVQQRRRHPAAGSGQGGARLRAPAHRR